MDGVVDYFSCGPSDVSRISPIDVEYLSVVAEYSTNISSVSNSALLGIFVLTFAFYLAVSRYDPLARIISTYTAPFLIIAFVGNIFWAFGLFSAACSEYRLFIGVDGAFLEAVRTAGWIRVVAVFVNYLLFAIIVIFIVSAHRREWQEKEKSATTGSVSFSADDTKSIETKHR